MFKSKNCYRGVGGFRRTFWSGFAEQLYFLSGRTVSLYQYENMSIMEYNTKAMLIWDEICSVVSSLLVYVQVVHVLSLFKSSTRSETRRVSYEDLWKLFPYEE